MAFVYRKRTPESGDIAEPRDLMDNLATLIGEFNGGLDADNIPEKAIDHDQVLIGSFTKLVSNASTTTVTFSGETSEWVGTNSSGTVLHEQKITTNADALLEIEWSATWENAGTFVESERTAYRVLVNGVEIARMVGSVRTREYHHTYLVGTAPVQGGQNTVSVQIRQFDLSNGGVLNQTGSPTTSVNERELIIRAYKR